MSPVKQQGLEKHGLVRQKVARALLLSIFVSLPVAGAILTFLEVFEDGIAGVDGLAGAQAVAVSPDGIHVYVAGHDDDAVGVFRSDASGSSLTFAGIVQDNGANVFLDGPTALVVSPDGGELFVTTDIDDSLSVFTRDATNDGLVQVAVFQDGVGAVDGIDGATDVAASLDGLRHIYVTGREDSALAVFAHDASTDDLGFTGKEQNGVGGVSGLAGASAVTISPDGELVLVTGADDDSLVVFARDATTDDLEFIETLTDGVDGVMDLRGPADVAFSSDGQDVYVASRLDDRVSLFHRTGSSLQYVVSFPTPAGTSAVRVSGDGRLVVAAAAIANALAVFERDPVDGTLTLVKTVEIGVDGVLGLEGVSGLAFRPGDSELYSAAMVANAMARFRNAAVVIFIDGFESGDTASWSNTSP